MYKLTTFIWVGSKKTNLRIRQYITVKKGLTWQEAKAERANNRSLQIVRTI